MIYRTNGSLRIECDMCDAKALADELTAEQFAQMWTTLSGLGWKAQKVESVWEHACPTCVEKNLTKPETTILQ